MQEQFDRAISEETPVILYLFMIRIKEKFSYDSLMRIVPLPHNDANNILTKVPTLIGHCCRVKCTPSPINKAF